MERFGGPAVGVERKSSATDMVSDADREAEAAIVELIHSERPDDGVVAEEGAAAPSSSGRRWVIDPLDGTTNYLYGFPMWAVSVAVEDDAGSVAGVVLDPVRDELFAAERGSGATLDGVRIRIRESTPLERSLVATGFSYDARRRTEQARVLERVIPHVRDVRRGGAAALDLAWVAAGRLDGYYERGLKPWDWAAGRLLVAEAGGTVTELEGEPPGLVAGAPELAAGLFALLGEDRRGV
jgi:myo-inositol-1(or 4)-monophosphatase